MNLVIISGAEATCKSDLAHRIADMFGYRYYSKDAIKEAMYDQLGHSTWDFSWYDNAAKEALFLEVSNAIRSKTDAVIESNFLGPDKERLASLIDASVRVKEIHCSTKGYISFRRMVARNEQGRRHRGHHDRRWYAKVFAQSTLKALGRPVGAHRPLGLTSDVFDFDASRYPHVDFDAVYSFVAPRHKR